MIKEEIQEVTESKYYVLVVQCSNCGFRNMVHIIKGETVKEQYCSQCKCNTVSRVF